MTDTDSNSNPNTIFIYSDIPALRERFLEWADKELDKPLSDERRAEINVLNETFDNAFDEFLDIALAADGSGRLRSLIFRMMICAAAYSKLAPPNENMAASVFQAHCSIMNDAKKQKSKEADNLLDKFLESLRGEWQQLNKIPVSLANLYSEKFRNQFVKELDLYRMEYGFPENNTWPSQSTVMRRIKNLKTKDN